MAKFNTDHTQWQSHWRLLLAAVFTVVLVVSCGKRVDPAPKPPPPPPFEFLNSWGDKGEGPGKLDAPVAFAVDILGNVFFADPGAGFVHKFESKGTPLLSFEDPRLHRASGIAVDSGGAIYVADAERGSVLIFFPDGTFLRPLQIPSQPHFAGPLGISLDDSGNLYVPDPARSRITKFNAHGRLETSWAAPKNPQADEKPSALTVAQDNSVFVAYDKSGRIEKYSSVGELITSWNVSDGLAGNASAMAGFAVGGQFAYALVLTPPRIRVWTLDGQHKIDAELGDQLGAVTAPQIAVTPHDELLVFDPSAPRVFRFRIHL